MALARSKLLGIAMFLSKLLTGKDQRGGNRTAMKVLHFARGDKYSEQSQRAQKHVTLKTPKHRKEGNRAPGELSLPCPKIKSISWRNAVFASTGRQFPF